MYNTEQLFFDKHFLNDHMKMAAYLHRGKAYLALNQPHEAILDLQAAQRFNEISHGTHSADIKETIAECEAQLNI